MARSKSLPQSKLRWMARVFGLIFFVGLSFAQQMKEMPMPAVHHARGTFTVNVQPLSPPPAEGLSRYSIDKNIHGDLEGATKGEMFSGGDPKKGVAGYVAIEIFIGILAGKYGSFALQHSATMDKSGPKMSVIVTPGSGTGELQGLAGTLVIQIINGIHSYDLEYTFPD